MGKKQTPKNEYTPEALKRLDERIERVEKELATTQAQIGDAAASDSNTWHDNPAFEQTQRRERELQTQLRELRDQREQAVVVSPTKSSSTVRVGSLVKVQYKGDDELITVRIGGHHGFGGRSADDVTEISSSSPLGKALMGHKAGQTVAFLPPTGGRTSVTIASVE